MLKQTSKMLTNENYVPPQEPLPVKEYKEYEQQREQISILMQQLSSQQTQINDLKTTVLLKEQEIQKTQSKFEGIVKQNISL